MKVDVTAAIKRAEIETRTSAKGGSYPVLILTLSSGSVAEANPFAPLDRGYLEMLQLLAVGTPNAPSKTS